MPSPRPPRILYAAGPGDVIGTYRHWKVGRDDPSEVALTYSGQFFDLCRETGAAGYVISYRPRRDRVEDEAFIVEHRPVPFRKGPAPLYHLAQIVSGLRLTLSALRFRADVAVVSGGAHWFTLSLLPLLGVKVLPTLHCVLWRKSRPPRGFNRLVHRLNARFFRRSASAILSLSRDITDQLEELTGGRCPAVIPFLPSYRRASFEGDFTPAAPPPFRVLFAGRVEANKGVYDLLAVAERFAREGRTEIEFDLCGTGGALDDLRRRATLAGLAGRFRCHGHLDRRAMRERYAAAHVVVAPTTRAFIEGFNKVVAEAVLAGKPVITSSVCPALEYVRPAVVEVPPDDVAAYGDAILSLADDPALLRAKRHGCAGVQEPFYDVSRSWGVALRRALGRLGAVDEDPPEATQPQGRPGQPA